MGICQKGRRVRFQGKESECLWVPTSSLQDREVGTRAGEAEILDTSWELSLRLLVCSLPTRKLQLLWGFCLSLLSFLVDWDLLSQRDTEGMGEASL